MAYGDVGGPVTELVITCSTNVVTRKDCNYTSSCVATYCHI